MEAKKYADFIRALEIVNVSLDQVQAKKIWSEGLPNNPVFSIHYEAQRLSANEKNLKFRANFIIKGYEEKEKESPDVLEILFSLELQYDISELDKSLFQEKEFDELLDIFKEKNIPVNCWPYAREFISSMTLRMGFPALVIGTFKYC